MLFLRRRSGYGIFFKATNKGQLLLPIDLATPGDAAFVTFLGSFTTAAGASYSIVPGITSVSVTRLSQSVSGVFALSSPLQRADVPIFQIQLSTVVSTALGVAVDSVTCTFLDQIAFVTSLSQTSVNYDIVFSISVDGALFDARSFGASPATSGPRLRLCLRTHVHVLLCIFVHLVC